MSATVQQKLIGVGYIAVVSTTGKTPWRDYIPVADVSNQGKPGRNDDTGHVPVIEYLSIGSKVAWRDYIPVARVATSGKRKWATDDAAYIPIVVTSTI